MAVAWIPPYGIAHDLFAIGLITWARHARRAPRRPPPTAWPRDFLTSIRLTLCCEIVFAWLFHQAADARAGVYFASDDPYWLFINRLTTAVRAGGLARPAYVSWTAATRCSRSGRRRVPPPVGHLGSHA